MRWSLPARAHRWGTGTPPYWEAMKSLKRPSSVHQISGVSSEAAASSCARALRPRSLGVLALTGMLLLTGCEVDPEADDDAGPEGGGPVGSGDEEPLQAPDPQGDQLSHEEMRDVLSDHVSEARLTDTDNYMSGLRDVETELARLVVDPQDCKQYVVQSASPVPEGALVVFADNTAADGDGSGAAPEDEAEAEAEDGDTEDGDTEDGVEEGADDGDDDAGQPESRRGGGLTFSAGSAPLTLPFENEGAEDGEEEPDDEEGSEEEDEEEPVEVDLPEDRQVTVYSFQDSLAADAHFSNELEGVENCASYTAVRSGPDEVEAETESSITEVEVGSQAEGAVGMIRELSYDETTEHSAIVMLREGAQVVALGVPLEEELEDEEAEAAVEELEDEAADVLEDLLGEELG